MCKNKFTTMFTSFTCQFASLQVCSLRLSHTGLIVSKHWSVSIWVIDWGINKWFYTNAYNPCQDFGISLSLSSLLWLIINDNNLILINNLFHQLRLGDKGSQCGWGGGGVVNVPFRVTQCILVKIWDQKVREPNEHVHQVNKTLHC